MSRGPRAGAAPGPRLDLAGPGPTAPARRPPRPARRPAVGFWLRLFGEDQEPTSTTWFELPPVPARRR